MILCHDIYYELTPHVRSSRKLRADRLDGDKRRRSTMTRNDHKPHHSIDSV
jgi:hypothetical protein